MSGNTARAMAAIERAEEAKRQVSEANEERDDATRAMAAEDGLKPSAIVRELDSRLSLSAVRMALKYTRR